MRTDSFRLLLVPAALLAGACDDSSNPIAPEEPPALEAATAGAEHTSGAQEDLAYWADGYLRSSNKTAASSTAEPEFSFNRSGGAMTITKVAGTTGRYVARFRGLSALLGGRSTVRVTGMTAEPTYCKPVGASLVRDSVEVRCFRMGTGSPANALFSLQVLGKRDDRAFAYAHQPTAAGYSPASAGSWNPTGATRVVRYAPGVYQVTFAGFAARFPGGVGGHVQVNAVGPSKAYCHVQEWGGSPDLTVSVACYTPAGALVDAKFTVMVTPPAAHLAYAWGESPTASYYSPHSTYSSNPVGGTVTVTRFGTGTYQIYWSGVDAEIRGWGNLQAAAYGEVNAHCKLFGYTSESAMVQCFAPDGAPADATYTVLMGS